MIIKVQWSQSPYHKSLLIYDKNRSFLHTHKIGEDEKADDDFIKFMGSKEKKFCKARINDQLKLVLLEEVGFQKW